MSVVWGQYRETLRRSILNDVEIEVETGDEEQPPRWSDEEILDLFSWASDGFCAHTALPASLVINASTINPQTETPYNLAVDTSFVLPSNIYEKLEYGGEVTIVGSGNVQYLDPINASTRLNPLSSAGYSTFPDTILNLPTPIGTGNSLHIKYFAYYPHPETDTDVLTVPRWAHAAIALLVGAHAMTAVAVKSAVISQWKSKPEAGQPENNALRVQHKWMLDAYERELSRYPRQDRANFFRGL